MRGGTESRALFGDGLLPDQGVHGPRTRATSGAEPDLRDPRASLLYADLPGGLAPAYVVTAGFDPLRDEGEAYARKLADAGVDGRAAPLPRPDPRLLQHGRRRSDRAANPEIAGMLRAALA